MPSVCLKRLQQMALAGAAARRHDRRMSPLPELAHAHTAAFFKGLTLSFGLIVAIGSQNAFVLRQGLKREHVVPIVAFCALADALLIAAGVMGMARAIGERQDVARALALLGALFLAWYGWQALRRATQARGLHAGALDGGLSRTAALSQAAAFTLLNPHVYLDTVLLVGSIGAQQPRAAQAAFIAGASLASVTWFSLLGFGARWLSPLFARPIAWRVLDGLIALTMAVLAALLLRGALQG
jgi:L-lysine exporter family protein LysE/ArgO